MGLRGRVDLLAVNAPYVPTDEIRLMPPEARLHEHHVALDGGADGLDLHRRVASGAPEWLATGRHPAHRDQPGPGGGHGRRLRRCRAPATILSRDESTLVEAWLLRPRALTTDFGPGARLAQ